MINVTIVGGVGLQPHLSSVFATSGQASLNSYSVPKRVQKTLKYL